MARHVFIVYSGPVDGREDEYNDWYENVHLGEVLAVPGFVSAERFELSGDPFQGPPPQHRYLCIYEMESDDPQGTMVALERASASMNVSSALDMDGATGNTYRAIGKRHVSV